MKKCMSNKDDPRGAPAAPPPAVPSASATAALTSGEAAAIVDVNGLELPSSPPQDAEFRDKGMRSMKMLAYLLAYHLHHRCRDVFCDAGRLVADIHAGL